MKKLCIVLAVLLSSNVNAEWGEQWGSMVWGQSSANVPMMGGIGQFIFFGLLLFIGVFVTKRWGLMRTLPAVAVLSLMPLIVEADEIQLNTFQNGQVADADDVNENFNNLKTAIENTNGAALTCDSGFKSYVGGRLCMSEPFGPATMRTAKNVCGSLASGSRVCKEADFYQACGSWLNGDADEDLNPFLGASEQGWLGDVISEGNLDLQYYIRGEKDCSRIFQYQLIEYSYGTQSNHYYNDGGSFQYQCCY